MRACEIIHPNMALEAARVGTSRQGLQQGGPVGCPPGYQRVQAAAGRGGIWRGQVTRPVGKQGWCCRAGRRCWGRRASRVPAGANSSGQRESFRPSLREESPVSRRRWWRWLSTPLRREGGHKDIWVPGWRAAGAGRKRRGRSGQAGSGAGGPGRRRGRGRGRKPGGIYSVRTGAGGGLSGRWRCL